MNSPGYVPLPDEYARLAQKHSIVPISKTVVADSCTPVGVFRKLSAFGQAFLLESVEGGERWGRYSFIGCDPFLVLKSYNGSVQWEGDVPSHVQAGGSVFDIFKSTLEGFSSPSLQGLPPFHGGGVGYLAYDFARYFERLPNLTEDDLGLPEVLLMFARTLLIFDHLRQRVTVVANALAGSDPGSAYEDATRRCDVLLDALSAGDGDGDIFELPQVQVPDPASNMTRDDFKHMVDRAKDYIVAGDIFQVALSQRFAVPLKSDSFDLYRVLRLVNPSPYMFYIRHPEICIVGSSPEPMIKISNDHVVQRPIAGTRARGATEAEDGALEAELVADGKERAEHLMLVDLARNDLGRVCEFGSVRVDEFMIVERYSHVMHLVSQTSGRLKAASTPLDALAASFPAGTVSGAPKVRAMEIIEELEPTRRGPYAGVVGYFDFSGNLDTCITLRTAVIKDKIAYVQAGAGIVADSDSDKEYLETLNKAGALLTAIAISSRLRG